MRGIEVAAQLEVLRSLERLSFTAVGIGFDGCELEDAIASGDVIC